MSLCLDVCVCVGREGEGAVRGGGVGRACQWFLISAAAVGLMLTYIQKRHDNKKMTVRCIPTCTPSIISLHIYLCVTFRCRQMNIWHFFVVVFFLPNGPFLAVGCVALRETLHKGQSVFLDVLIAATSRF